MVKRKNEWFHHVELYKRSARIRAAIAMQKKRGGTSDITIPRQVSSYVVKNKGMRGKVGDLELRLYTIKDLSTMYQVSNLTVKSWWRKGMLPMPFMFRRIGNSDSPLWVKGQMDAIVLCLNDIYGQGCARFCMWHGKHIEMMKVGADLALKALDDDTRSISQKRKDIGGEYGVMWQ